LSLGTVTNPDAPGISFCPAHRIDEELRDAKQRDVILRHLELRHVRMRHATREKNSWTKSILVGNALHSSVIEEFRGFTTALNPI
jgi:hypothetical protein